MGFLNLTKIESSFMNVEPLKKQLGWLSITMSKAKENLITRRHGKTRRMRSLMKGRKVSNLLDSGINRGSHPKMKISQLEWWGKSQEIHSRSENHSNVGDVDDPTCT